MDQSPSLGIYGVHHGSKPGRSLPRQLRTGHRRDPRRRTAAGGHRVVSQRGAVGGAVASGYLATGILLDLARCIGRWANTGIGSRPVRRSQGRLPIAQRLVAGALGVGLLSAVALPAHATGEWDPGWQALAPAVVATETTVPTPVSYT